MICLAFRGHPVHARMTDSCHQRVARHKRSKRETRLTTRRRAASSPARWDSARRAKIRDVEEAVVHLGESTAAAPQLLYEPLTSIDADLER